MRNANRKRALLTSSSIVLLCMSIIIGVTYALFTDSHTIVHHLKAGDLDITLVRTDLEYVILNKQGVMEKIVNPEDYDFTNPTEDSVFGLDSKDIKIVPGSYFEAVMEIGNGPTGDVAFEYAAGFELKGDVNALAEQLLITVKDASGTVVVNQKPLSEFAGDGYTFLTGSMKVGDAAQSFTVRMEFVDDVAVNGNETAPVMDNDAAQGQEAKFDLVVRATQSTTIETTEVETSAQ